MLTIQIYLVSDRSPNSLAKKIKSRSLGLALTDFFPLLLVFSATLGFFVFAIFQLLSSYRRPKGLVVPSIASQLRKPSSSSAEQDGNSSASHDDSTSKLDRKPDLFLQDNPRNRPNEASYATVQPNPEAPPQTLQRAVPEFGFIFLSCFYFGASVLGFAVVLSVVRYSRGSGDGKLPLLIALSCLQAYLLAGTICLLFQFEKLR